MYTQPKMLIRIKEILLIVFIIFLSFGFTYGIKILSYVTVGEKLEAKVTSVINTERELSIIYSYNINGKTYEDKTHNYNNKHMLGDKITVYVKENKPEETIILSRSLPLVVFDFIFFIPAVIIVLLPIIKYYSYKKKAINIINNGKKIKLKITDIIQDFDNEKYEVVPFKIVCLNGDKTYTSPLYYLDYKDPEKLVNTYINVYFLEKEYYIDPTSIVVEENNYAVF